jgi:hypothetical protein
MKRLMVLAVLAGLLGFGATASWAAALAAAHCNGCCTSPADCRTPSCCSH